MMVVDAHIHLWDKGLPRSAHRQTPYHIDQALMDMDDAGVHAAIVQPPAWDADANAIAIKAAQAHPHRIGVLGNFDLQSKDNIQTLQDWKSQAGMLGLRYILNEPLHATWLRGDALNWLWSNAQTLDIPIAIAASSHLQLLGPIAKAHPHLRLIIDHLGVPLDAKGSSAFQHMEQLAELSRHPNIAIKATAVPAYSAVSYPHDDIAASVKTIFNHFGAHRFFWGSDITKLNCSWKECVELFTMHTPWLKGEELQLVMGQALIKWLNWDIQNP